MNGDAFRTREGRLRLGWRLTLYAVLLLALTVWLATSLPPTLAWSSLALLTAALISGWTLLALDGRSPAALGFTLGGEAPLATMSGFGLGSAVFLSGILLVALVGGVRWVSEPGSPGAFLASGGVALGVLAVPAAAEEALLRGYPLQALSEAWGPATALLLTSAAFGLLHIGNPEVSWVGITNTATAGLFLGALYLRTGSLWWTTGAHLGWNWTQGFLLDLPVSGVDVANAPWIKGTAVGSEVLSGGAFGPEGSVLVTGALVCAAAWVWRTPRLTPTPAARAVPPLARLRERSSRPVVENT